MRVLAFILICTFVLFVFYPSIINIPQKIVSKLTSFQFFGKKIPKGLAIILIVFAVLFIIEGIDIVIRYLYRKINIKSIKVSHESAEINIGEKGKENKDSILNEYLDELLYFFESTNYNVVVIEDLDRFRNTDIFIRLRELNIILNKYEKINRKIKFIYAIKDDMFSKDNRSKFFDSIIPIIPYLSSSNSFEIMDQKIKALNLDNLSVSRDYLLDVSPFVNDMRMLDNIMNEFYIYWLNIQPMTYSEKLFSVILLKNMVPDEFAHLQTNKGLVYNTLKNKNSLIEVAKGELESQKNLLQKELKDLDEFKVNRLSELKDMFIGVISKKLSSGFNYSSIEISYDSKPKMKLDNFISSNDIDYKIISNLNISYSYNSRYYSNEHSILKADQEILDFVHSIYIRKKSFEEIVLNSKKQLNREIGLINEQIIHLETSSLAELATLIDIKFSDDYEDEKYDIVKFLLKRGYIDENYFNYISYFHPGNLTSKDNHFILSIKNEGNGICMQEIDNIPLVVEKLNKRDFTKTKLLNVYILYYFLDAENILSQHACACKQRMLQTLYQDSSANKGFLKNFVHFNKTMHNKNFAVLKKLARLLCENYERGFELISDACYEQVDNYGLKEITLEILDVLTAEELMVQNKNGKVESVIQGMTNFIDIAKDLSNINQKIGMLEIKFKNLEIQSKNSLSDYVFENGLFEFGYSYLKNVKNLYFSRDEEFELKNYTLIQKSEYEWLQKTINSNLNKYVEILISLKDSYMDDGNYVLELLEQDDLNEAYKIKLIEIEQLAISKRGKIRDTLYDDLLSCNMIIANWNNIEVYCGVYGVTNILVEFIKANKDIISQTSLLNNQLAVELLGCYDLVFLIDEGVYDELKFNSNDLSDARHEVVSKLLNRELLNITRENVNALMESHPEVTTELIVLADSDDLIDLAYSNENIKRIFMSKVDVLKKICILKSLNISELEYKNLKLITEFIAENYNVCDIEHAKVQQIVSKVDKESIINFVVKSAIYLSDNEIIDLLSFDEKLKELVTFRKQPKLTKNNQNLALLNILKGRELIGSFTEKKENYVVYTKKL